MIAEAFMVCALAMQPLVFTEITRINPDPGGTNGSKISHQFFWSEWNWLKEYLEKKYPDYEFMILPVEYAETPPGWTWIPWGWRGHLLYRRPLKEAA